MVYFISVIGHMTNLPENTFRITNETQKLKQKEQKIIHITLVFFDIKWMFIPKTIISFYRFVCILINSNTARKLATQILQFLN